MPGPTESASKHPAPRWGVWLFGLAIPIAIWSMFSTLVMAMGVFAIFDFTPALLLGLALLTRRWSGISTRGFGVAAVLAGVMLLQWVPWYVWMFSQRWPDLGVINILSEVYALELLALVVLVLVASVRSIRGIRRERAAAASAAEATLVDAWSTES
jgi:hypothetical protein